MSLDRFVDIPEKLRPDELRFCEENKDFPIFLEHVRIDITQTNNLIDNFNRFPTKENLKLIHAYYLDMIYKYRGDYLKKCRVHSQQLKNLYSQLLANSHDFFPDQKSIFSISAHTTQQTSILDLGDIIANLSNEACAELLELLLHPDRLKLDNPLLDEKLPEFKAFLRNHAISFIGGLNSKNFLITTPEGETFVLKAFDNIDNPLRAAKSLQQSPSLQNAQNPVYFERITQNIFNNYYFIQLSPYCPQKDLATIAAKEHDSLVEESSLSSRALIYFTQMSLILKELSAINLAFPDMKMSNWATLANGQLLILDNKSIIFSDVEKKISRVENIRQGYSGSDFLYTQGYTTPDMISFLNNHTDSFSAEQMHSYLLGINLRQFLYGPKDKNRIMIRTSSLPILQKILKVVDSLSNPYEEMPNIEALFTQFNLLLLQDIQVKIDRISENFEPPTIITTMQQLLHPSITLENIDNLTNLYKICESLDLIIKQLKEIKVSPFNQKNSPFNLYFKSFRDKLNACDSIALYQETHDEIMTFHQHISTANNLLSTIKHDFSFSDEDVAINAYIEEMQQRFTTASSLAEIEAIVAEINTDIQNLNASRFNELKTTFLDMKAEKKLPALLESIETILNLMPIKERMLPLNDTAWHNAKMAISAYNRSLSNQTMYKPSKESALEPTPKKGPKT